MNADALRFLLDEARGLKLLCVGDVMLDRFVRGEVARVSPEAPIPVLAFQDETAMLGAAGNVARNAAALGAKVTLAGVVGEDGPGAETRRLAEAEPGLQVRLVTDPARRTTVKTRFAAAGHQLLRLDDEDARPLDAAVEASLAAAVREASAGAACLLLSDYAKGALTPGVIAAAREAGAPVIVDPKGAGFAKYGPVAVIKPNARELAATTGLPVGSDEEIEAALAAALAACSAEAIVVTRAGAGLSIGRRGRPVVHLHARTKGVFDVSGAGDTTLAALGLGLAAGRSLEEAASLAVLASGVVVGKPGTAVVTGAELRQALEGEAVHPFSEAAPLDAVLRQAELWRGQGLRIGFTNGCFDIIHAGHVALLTEARDACDRLIVGVNSDASVRGLKGAGRPVHDLDSRAKVLCALACVDAVTVFADPTPLTLIQAIRPDVLVKGADYKVDEVVGAELVQAYGGRVHLARLVEGQSTTAALRRLQA